MKSYLNMNVNRFFEQSFLSLISRPIREIQANGPIALQVGQGCNSRKELFMVHIRAYRCKLCTTTI